MIANVLGIRDIWIHPMAGVLSAYGMGLADIRVERQRSVELPFESAQESAWLQAARELAAECNSSLAEQRVPAASRNFTKTLGLKIAGSDTVIDVSLADIADMAREFGSRYRGQFGAAAVADQIIVATVTVASSGKEREFTETTVGKRGAARPHWAQMWLDGKVTDTPVYRRDELGSGFEVAGPAIIVDDHSTTVVDPGWQCRVNDHGHLLLHSEARHEAPVATGSSPDPVRLEVFNQLFMHIAEQMGSVLQSTALSVNIRERLDFSCALFDEEGRLVSNAPHMPVHLGSMGESVRSVIRHFCGELKDGDAVMLNSPYNGGTHLPDITVVTPMFGDSDRALFYFASRAHHADIGGMSPGSMPSASTTIDEEGVLIDNFLLVRDGALREREARQLLADAPCPARNPDQNIADIKAQLAANQQGIRQMLKAIERYGLQTVQAYLGFVRDNAAQSVRRLLGSLHDGRFEYEMDSGERICVVVDVDAEAGKARIDFGGTSPQSPGNFNAPEAVTRAAVLYVFRSLIDDPIPMNEGCLEPLDIVVPGGCMLSPSYPAAVVAGNVETSQCVTDSLYGALGTLAASQGTMNNLSFGNERVQYYETIAGGSGAGDGFAGADAVQTHMTNSRLTDPEVLEQKFPVILERFSVRHGSGGAGRWQGGNGAVRQLQFTDAVAVSILSNHRRIAPFGAAGGEEAATGRNEVVRAGGERQPLPATATVHLDSGDRLLIETPGGGGYGKP